MPRFLGRQNARKAPAAALWLTNGLVQLFLLATLFAKEAYAMALNLTSSMALIPYLLVAGYALRLAASGETYEREPAQRRRELLLAVVAILFSIFVLYVGGPA